MADEVLITFLDRSEWMAIAAKAERHGQHGIAKSIRERCETAPAHGYAPMEVRYSTCRALASVCLNGEPYLECGKVFATCAPKQPEDFEKPPGTVTRADVEAALAAEAELEV